MDIQGSSSRSSSVAMPLVFNKVNSVDAFEGVSKLMKLTPEEWKARSIDIFNSKLDAYAAQCTPTGKSGHAGFFERHDIEPGSEVIVIGDIHGHDLRLDLTLKVLQQRGVLDAHFHCLPGKKIVFLGDYADRGSNSLKVIELVATLKMENMHDVFLLRGNHEDLKTSEGKLERYAQDDPKYLAYMQQSSNTQFLNKFYESLPVSVYLGQKAPLGEKKQYMQFSHALFDLHSDPFPLFSSAAPDDHLWLPRAVDFSKRMVDFALLDLNDKKSKAMQELVGLQVDLLSVSPAQFEDIYWHDVGDEFGVDRYTGRAIIPPEKIKAYLSLSGNEHCKVVELMRGHQLGDVWELKHGEKIVATTVDPSGDSRFQRFIAMEVDAKVRDWKKRLVKIPLSDDHELALQKVTQYML